VHLRIVGLTRGIECLKGFASLWVDVSDATTIHDAYVVHCLDEIFWHVRGSLISWDWDPRCRFDVEHRCPIIGWSATPPLGANPMVSAMTPFSKRESITSVAFEGTVHGSNVVVVEVGQG
jgi:hypothetical protein